MKKKYQHLINNMIKVEKILVLYLLLVLAARFGKISFISYILTKTRKNITQKTTLSPENIYLKTIISFCNLYSNNSYKKGDYCQSHYVC